MPEFVLLFFYYLELPFSINIFKWNILFRNFWNSLNSCCVKTAFIITLWVNPFLWIIPLTSSVGRDANEWLVYGECNDPCKSKPLTTAPDQKRYVFFCGNLNLHGQTPHSLRFVLLHNSWFVSFLFSVKQVAKISRTNFTSNNNINQTVNHFAKLPEVYSVSSI
jgi:hypothetical protein